MEKKIFFQDGSSIEITTEILEAGELATSAYRRVLEFIEELAEADGGGGGGDGDLEILDEDVLEDLDDDNLIALDDDDDLALDDDWEDDDEFDDKW